jgi:hypothetical protein
MALFLQGSFRKIYIQAMSIKNIIYTLLVCISQQLVFCQNIDGSISVTFDEEKVEIPIRTNTSRYGNKTNILVYGNSDNPMPSSILMSVSIFPCIIGSAEIDSSVSFICFKRIFRDKQEFYCSFDFGTSNPSFMMIKDHQSQDISTQKESAQLYVSIDGHKSGKFTASGCFSSFHRILNGIRYKGKQSIILEGNFEFNATDPYIEQVSYFTEYEELPSTPTLMNLQPYIVSYFPSSSTEFDIEPLPNRVTSVSPSSLEYFNQSDRQRTSIDERNQIISTVRETSIKRSVHESRKRENDRTSNQFRTSNRRDVVDIRSIREKNEAKIRARDSRRGRR